ncbi:hypothetical protein FQR65_LT19695 [Abscondita terminalis]|nr:hypothetical protein FQR65_LT19695 [Abscondita terminalis]
MEEKMQQNREMILLSARELVAQGGFKDAQIQAIADRAGVSSGLVYRYFENKNQVLIEVLNAAIHIEVNILNDIAHTELTAVEKLHRAVTTFVKRAMNSPRLSYSLLFEPVDPQFELERFQSKQLIKESIIKILTEGRHSGAMTFVVIEPLSIAKTKRFDKTYKEYFVKQIADFCLQAVKVKHTIVSES